jgi:hypothetical protein
MTGGFSRRAQLHEVSQAKNPPDIYGRFIAFDL